LGGPREWERGFAAELGYDVTVVKDATADYSEQFVRSLSVDPREA